MIRKILYCKLIPRPFLRFIDELLQLAAMWLPGNILRVLFNRLRGVKIGSKVYIGYGSLLGNHPFLLKIGNNVVISAGVKILTHDTSFTVIGGKDLAGEVKIGSNVQLGANTIILPGVSIGDKVIIGAGSVVNKDIASGNIAAGVPARIISNTSEGLLKLEDKLKEEKYFSTW